MQTKPCFLHSLIGLVGAFENFRRSSTKPLPAGEYRRNKHTLDRICVLAVNLAPKGSLFGTKRSRKYKTITELNLVAAILARST